MTAAKKPAAKKDRDQTVEELSQALAADHAEPTTLVGGAELAGAQLGRNEVSTMEPDAEGLPARDE